VRFESGCQMSVLGGYVFAYCWSLQAICIPSSVRTIKDYSFAHCHMLSSVTFEPGCQIASLGKSAFIGCLALQSICVPSSNGIISNLYWQLTGVFRS
jgi:hypothetical protein